MIQSRTIKIEEKEKEAQKIEANIKEIKINIEKIENEQKERKRLAELIKKEVLQVHKAQNELINIPNCSMTQMDLKKSIISKQIPKGQQLSKNIAIDEEIIAQNIKNKEEEIRKEVIVAENKQIIKLMKAKTAILKRLMEVKAEGGYYGAHKRVVLKQLVELMRQQNRQLEDRVKRKQFNQLKYEKAQRQLNMSCKELQQYLKEKK